ncbi:hypothetical protein AB834_04240 [PVC group bacterium (ex Bugula neritina AB1)]|nr:hypothetical protein AB834_04240 [PVC group bacterium (ex Bugula neritina AB1)]
MWIEKLEKLIDVVATLRGPGGCAWDKKQTHDSVKIYLLEEAYEFIDAIEKNDLDNMKEELGDLLFQILFHCQMGQEKKNFTFEEVVEDITEKMISRHPHVFEDEKTDDIELILKRWEEIKSNEKNKKDRTSPFENIPQSMPALSQATKVLRKAFKEKCLEKKTEETILENIQKISLENQSVLSKEDKEKQIAEILFNCAELAERESLDPEKILRDFLKNNVKKWTSK